MDSKDDSSHVWSTSAEHEENAAQVKSGLSSLVLITVFQLGTVYGQLQKSQLLCRDE